MINFVASVHREERTYTAVQKFCDRCYTCTNVGFKEVYIAVTRRNEYRLLFNLIFYTTKKIINLSIAVELKVLSKNAYNVEFVVRMKIELLRLLSVSVE